MKKMKLLKYGAEYVVTPDDKCWQFKVLKLTQMERLNIKLRNTKRGFILSVTKVTNEEKE